MSSSLFQGIALQEVSERDKNVSDVSKVGLSLGYTELHLACLNEHDDKVSLLVKDINVDINAVADDGAQPLHLACLFRHFSIAETLLAHGADVNAKVGKDVFNKKYDLDEMWSDKFGNKIALIAYAVITEDHDLVEILLEYEPELPRTLSNKTLIMCAIELGDYKTAWDLIKFSKINNKLVNARDDYGRHAVHFILPMINFEEFRDNQKNVKRQFRVEWIIKKLIRAGADINATVDGNPDTLLLNIAAYRGFYQVVRILLPHSSSAAKSKALYYATLSSESEDPQLYLRKGGFSKPSSKKDCELNRTRTIKEIYNDVLVRRTVGLTVFDEEQQLIDQLLTEDYKLKYFKAFEQNYIKGNLKKEIIEIENDKITLYDLAVQIFHDKTIKHLIKDKIRVDNIKKGIFSIDFCRDSDDDGVDDDNSYKKDDYHEYEENDSYYYFCERERTISRIYSRIRTFRKRSILLEKFQEIPLLRKFIPLPYEIVLIIIEYLNNHDLEFFIDAFYN